MNVAEKRVCNVIETSARSRGGNIRKPTPGDNLSLCPCAHESRRHADFFGEHGL